MSVKLHWFLPTYGDSRLIVGGGHGTPAGVAHNDRDASVAKVAAARASLEASSVLFELGGTRSAPAGDNLSRYWRDARTHTLHDATRWKLQHIGRHTLSGTRPPRHGQV